MPVGQRAAEAIAKNPEKSNRAVAAELGVSHVSVQRARNNSGGTYVPPDRRVGKDGKSYPAKATHSDEDPYDDTGTGIEDDEPDNYPAAFLLRTDHASRAATDPETLMRTNPPTRKLAAAARRVRRRPYRPWGLHAFFKSGWKRFYLKWYDDFLPSARTLCPKTVTLLDFIPNIHGAMFAILPPGARLGAHRDPFAGSLRYHLGLKTPNSPKCHIFVDGNECIYRDGEDFLFDETFIHHAENATDQTRIILFCDVERPKKYAFMTNFNRWVSHHIIKASATANMDGERVGALNKAFSYLAEIHQAARRLKNWNRNAYYALKFSVVSLAVAGVLYATLR